MAHAGNAATAVKFYSPYTGLFVVRCDAAQHRNVWAAATLLTEIRRRVVAIRLVVLTGAHVCPRSVESCVPDLCKPPPLLLNLAVTPRLCSKSHHDSLIAFVASTHAMVASTV